MKAAEKSHAAKHRSRTSHSFRHYLWTISSPFLIFSWMFMLVYPPLSHVSYFTTRQSPSDLPEHFPPLPPPPPPQLPLRSTISSLPNQIHFSPSHGTSFHFINLSHLKLNESPAWFLLFFFIPACSFYNSPTHPPPGFSTPPLDFACPPLWMLPHAERRESGGGAHHSSEEALSVVGSRGWEPLSSPLGSESWLRSASGLGRA